MAKSLVKNTITYTVKVISGIIFPLITLPYISRILSPEGLGNYNFSQSIVSYFQLLAGLGISTYAIREGARLKAKSNELEKMSQEIFTINVISSLLAEFLLFLLVFSIPFFKVYRGNIVILSFAIVLTAIGTEWIYTINEDYMYITFRSIGIQFVSIILMLLLVKSRNDVLIYCFITVLATASSNLLNYRKAKKYFQHKLVFSRSVFRHFKPILVLFASQVACQIYVSSDTTMLGILLGDYEVGIYSGASKIYNMLRTLLATFVTVLLPRLSFCSNDRKEYDDLLKKTIGGYLAVVVPCAVGIFLIGDDIIELLLGSEYLNASASLKLLSIALVFSTMGSFIANSVLVVYKRENKILYATIIGAIVNFVANIFLIPTGGATAAAMTTLLSEVIVFSIQLYYSREYVRSCMLIKYMKKLLLPSFGIIVVCVISKKIIFSIIVRLCISIILSGIGYITLLVVLKYDGSTYVIRNIKKKLGRKIV